MCLKTDVNGFTSCHLTDVWINMCHQDSAALYPTLPLSLSLLSFLHIHTHRERRGRGREREEEEGEGGEEEIETRQTDRGGVHTRMPDGFL